MRLWGCWRAAQPPAHTPEESLPFPAARGEGDGVRSQKARAAKVLRSQGQLPPRAVPAMWVAVATWRDTEYNDG